MRYAWKLLSNPYHYKDSYMHVLHTFSFSIAKFSLLYVWLTYPCDVCSTNFSLLYSLFVEFKNIRQVHTLHLAIAFWITSISLLSMEQQNTQVAEHITIVNTNYSPTCDWKNTDLNCCILTSKYTSCHECIPYLCSDLFILNTFKGTLHNLFSQEAESSSSASSDTALFDKRDKLK